MNIRIPATASESKVPYTKTFDIKLDILPLRSFADMIHSIITAISILLIRLAPTKRFFTSFICLTSLSLKKGVSGTSFIVAFTSVRVSLVPFK